MKDFVRDYLRIAVIFAGAAFLLSIIVGLIAGNLFGTALLRAFLVGICFGVLGVAFTFIVKKYLPELAGEAMGEGAPRRDAEERHKVDIVLPEENPRSPSEVTELQSPEEVGAEPVEDLASEESAGESADGYSDKEADTEPVEEVAGEESGAPTRAADLDILPDIAGIAGPSRSPAASSFSPEPAGEPSRAGRPHADAADLANEDPETLARAIRTVLKRDERG